MPANELTFTLAPSGRLSVETFTRAFQNALEMLRSLEPDFVESGVPVRWEIVRVSMRSPLRLTVAPKIEGKGSNKIARKLIDTCLKGIKGIESTAALPKHFNEEALDAARKMIQVTQKEGAAIKVGSGKQDEVMLTEQAVKHIEEIEQKARLYMDFGSIEGRLEVLSIHGGESFTIWESFTNRRVDCSVTPEQFQVVKELLGKRVAVTGRVRYRNHVPKTIHVESVRSFPDDSELPDLKDIGPIDITEGLSSEEHVRRMRNG